jgi:hypothetical protein
MSEKEETPEHTRWLDKLEKEFNDNRFTTIREGKMFLPGAHWKEPDLFALHGPQLLLVLEVIAEPSYREVLKKVKRIKQRYNQSQLVVFEPVEYMDKKFLEERKEHYRANYTKDHYPTTFKEIENICVKKWRKEEGIEVVFWNEKDYQAHVRELASKFTLRA